jgi:hypothetical protein
MATNDSEYQRQYKQKHYAENKQKYIDQAKARRSALKAEIWELKRQPCMDCGVEYNPWIMQFDHREGVEKEGVISKLVNQYQRTKVFIEIEKCDIVCANCHADRTYKRIISVSG